MELKLHVLVMEFLGKSGAAAPRIRDARLSQAELREAYLDLLLILRKLYQECRLVHGDLSEYNLLVREGQEAVQLRVRVQVAGERGTSSVAGGQDWWATARYTQLLSPALTQHHSAPWLALAPALSPFIHHLPIPHHPQWHEGEVWVIDVSQAVDLDHPHALTFLREDCAHVNAYFRRSGVATLTTRELFEFVVDPTVDDTNQDATLQALVSGMRWCVHGQACRMG